MTGYLAADGFVEQLVAELGDVTAVHGRLVLADGPPRPAAWAADVWLNPEHISIRSINDGIAALQARGRHWALYSFHLHRRARLIAEPWRRWLSVKAVSFPATPPPEPVGGWTLLDEHTILAATRRSCPFALGEIHFVEDRTGPPSRAYLKLWELFSRLGVWPKAGDRCVDLGASPGGWTWVLQRLGARVVAVDKAPLKISLPGVEFRAESAFGVRPEPADWLFSDVICEPARLLKLVERWLPVAPNIVCTLKFKGATDHAMARAFAAIPGSHLLHLHHNRHELTWFRLAVSGGG